MGRDIGASFIAPKDAVTLDFPRSDGHPSRRPDQPKKPTDGSVNFFRLVAHTEPAHARWRTEVATRMASLIPSLDKTKKYILSAFPDGYELYDHQKGSRDDPRHDLYLFGSTITTKFRSVNEFVPHALWLYNNDGMLCGCRYCTKSKNQGDISQQYGLPSHTKSEAAPVVMRRIVRPTLVPAPDQRTVVQRDADLRATARATRRYRVGEVAWCQVEPPLVGPNPDVCIRWWPAIVREVRLKSTVTERGAPQPKSGARSTYAVRQSHIYKMQLLAVFHSHIVPEEMILPYLAVGPSTELIEVLQNETVVPKPLSSDLRELAHFYPMPTPPPSQVLDGDDKEPLQRGTWEDALAPYGLAMQIAAYISMFWSLSDEWEFKPKTSKLFPKLLDTPAVSTSDSATTTTTVAAAAASGEAEADSSPRLISRAQTEWRYQGIWWGTERIWQDDLVRIHPYRDQIMLDELLPASDQADTRTLFMLISSIFIANRAEMHKGKIVGLLYELAPEDWEDSTVSATNSPTKASSNKGKEKEKELPLPDQPLSTPLRRAAPTIPGQPPLRWDLPPPPRGFVFRLITPPGFEVVLDISMLSGRYYSDLLESAPGRLRLQELSFDKVDTPGEEIDTDRLEGILSLGGLEPSYRCKMDCVEWKRTRYDMLLDADKISRAALYDYFCKNDVQEIGDRLAETTVDGGEDAMLID